MDKIINAILGNEKRVTKLKAQKNHWERLLKCQRMVVAECREQKIALYDMDWDLKKTVAYIVYKLEKEGNCRDDYKARREALELKALELRERLQTERGKGV